jgi:hypothetical protein
MNRARFKFILVAACSVVVAALGADSPADLWHAKFKAKMLPQGSRLFDDLQHAEPLGHVKGAAQGRAPGQARMIVGLSGTPGEEPAAAALPLTPRSFGLQLPDPDIPIANGSVVVLQR